MVLRMPPSCHGRVVGPLFAGSLAHNRSPFGAWGDEVFPEICVCWPSSGWLEVGPYSFRPERRVWLAMNSASAGASTEDESRRNVAVSGSVHRKERHLFVVYSAIDSATGVLDACSVRTPFHPKDRNTEIRDFSYELLLQCRNALKSSQQPRCPRTLQTLSGLRGSRQECTEVCLIPLTPIWTTALLPCLA